MISASMPKTEVVLRPYQVEALHAVESARKRGVNRGLIVLATGLGKTSIAAAIIKEELERGGRALFMAHRAELLDQAAQRFEQMVPGAEVGIEAASCKAHQWCNVVVASVATIGLQASTRLSWFKPTLVFCDESHHSPAASYMNAARRFGCFDGSATYLGLTATPHRMDNKPLHGEEDAIFEEVLYDYGIKPAIADGWLSDIRAYRALAGYSLDGIRTSGGDYAIGALEEVVNTDAENMAAISHWHSVAKDRPTIVFCTGVAHTRRLTEMFCAAGVKARYVDGTQQPDERAAAIRACKAGECQVLVNCSVCTEGFDWPEASCILLLRPTKSWSLFAQMIGRGLRLSPGKKDCIVIDIIGEDTKGDSASVSGVFGLPRGMKQNGVSMKDASKTFDDLPAWMQARLAGREFDLEGIDGVLREIDLLAELDPPSEVQMHSTFAWQRISEWHYTIRCGSCRERGFHREAAMRCDALGNWTVALYETDPGAVLPQEVSRAVVGDNLRSAFRGSDAFMEGRWPNVSAVASRNAAWRKRTAKSEKQLYYLRKYGLSEAEIEAMDAGRVSEFLDRKFAQRRKV